MRSSVAFLLLLRVLPSVGQVTTPAIVCQEGPAARSECKGIQGTGKNRDICCAANCTCACGGDIPENSGRNECNLGTIRGEPPGKCTSSEVNAACVLDPEPISGAPCGTVNGVVVDGVLDEDGMLCCPKGCGTCGGDECSTMPMSWVKPDPLGGALAVDPSVPADASSGDYCCMKVMENLTAVCGVDGAVPPCRMPQEPVVKDDTCGVEGIQGTVHSGGQMCCPLTCNICGSLGCGEQHISEVVPGDLPWSTSAPPDATTADYCCTGAFEEDLDQDRFCGDAGVEPPCLIRGATLPPRDLVEDTCMVEGMEGVANGNKCCPLGCGQCGGAGCGTIDMGYVLPTIMGPTPPFGAKSSKYCCSGTTTFTEDTPVCGDGNFPPCYIDQGAGATTAPAVAPSVTAPSPPVSPMDLPDTCNLPGIPGILDSKGSRCCPQGCGMCGGEGCGKVDMALVAPTVYGGVAEGAKAGDYCCLSGVDKRAMTCGTGDPVVHPPCFVPAAPAPDTCYVEGVEGVASSSRKHCCPLGCGQCGGAGCGSVPLSQIFSDGREIPLGATASTYCCTKGFTNTTLECNEPNAEPPCFIPAGTPTPPPVITPAPMGTTVGGGDPSTGGGGGPDGDGSTTPSPAADDGGSSPRGGTSFTASPAATPAPSATMTSCKNVLVMIEDAEEFDGIYVMDMVDETMFVKNDTSAVMQYSPHEADDMGDTNTTAECGHWMLAMLKDENFTMAEFPVVAVQDCATNPEDIDPQAMWGVKNGENETEVVSVGTVDCLDNPMTPSPSAVVIIDDTPSPTTTPGGGPTGTGEKPADGVEPTPAPEDSPPVSQPAAPPVAPPVQPGGGGDVAPTTVTGDSKTSGLSTPEAVGVGVGVSAVAIVGAVAVSRWAKSRN